MLLLFFAGTLPLQRGRPMGMHCQPNTAPDGSASTLGEVEHDLLLGPEGWCNADKPVHRCRCTVDGVGGAFCELPREQVCLNQCNGTPFPVRLPLCLVTR